MNKVYIEEVSEVSSGKPVFWEVKESRGPHLGLYSIPFYLKVKSKEDALLLKKIINENINNYFPVLTSKKIE